MQQPCNSSATALQQRCNSSATAVQQRCNRGETVQTEVQQLCNSIATAVQQQCNSSATAVQKQCNSNAKAMQQRCNSRHHSLHHAVQTHSACSATVTCARAPKHVLKPSCVQLGPPPAFPWQENCRYRPALLRAASRRRSRAEGLPLVPSAATAGLTLQRETCLVSRQHPAGPTNLALAA